MQSRCEQMSSSVLRERLRELVTAGFVETDDAGLYGLTADGQELMTALGPLLVFAEQWGHQQAR